MFKPALETIRRDRTPALLWIGAALFGGLLCDFVLSGVFKVIWILIYAPTYFMVAMTLETYLRSKTRFGALNLMTTAALLTGALGGHFLMVGSHRELQFDMAVASRAPVVLQSADWPQKLYVSSENVAKSLIAASSTPSNVGITADEVLDYGCIRAFAIDTVNGIDVKNDRNAAWTLKPDDNFAVIDSGPGTEDHWMPWCKISFYRTK